MFVLALLSGCGSKKVVLASLTGRVTFQGKPVGKDAKILFVDAKRGQYIAANLDDDGRYRVSVAEGFGLYPSEYQVAIVPSPPPLTGKFNEKVPIVFRKDIPVRYHLVETSKLRMTLDPSGQVYDVEMTP